MTATIGFVSAITGFAEEEKGRRTKIVTGYLPDGYEMRYIDSPQSPRFLDSHENFDELRAAWSNFFGTIDPEDVDVLIAAGGIDPALHEIRAACRVPVIGPGEASLYIAASLGRPTTVLVVDDYAVAAAEIFLDQTQTKPPIASIRPLGTPVREILQDRALGERALRRETMAAVQEDNAGAVFMGCMTLGSLGMAEDLQREVGVPVLDPLRISTAAAVQAAHALGVDS
jgi:allantoin racemase